MQMHRNQHEPYPDGAGLENGILFLFNNIMGRTQQVGLTRAAKLPINVTGWIVWYWICCEKIEVDGRNTLYTAGAGIAVDPGNQRPDGGVIQGAGLGDFPDDILHVVCV